MPILLRTSFWGVRFVGREGVRQGKTQHVKELYSVLEDWFRIITEEEITVNACNSKAMPLVESELIAERASAHLQLLCA